mgnify:CR=1 FL=1
MRQRFPHIVRLFLVCLTSFTSLLFAQVQHSYYGEIQLRNFGYDAGFYQKSVGFNKKTQKEVGIQLGSLVHPKEVYVLNTGLPGSRIFKIDKINYAWVLKPRISYRYPLAKRSSRFEIGVSLFGGFQLPLAYSWPVYVFLYDGNVPFDGYADVRYDPDVHEPKSIGGNASFSRGIKDGKFTPGIGSHAGVSLEWGNYRNFSNELSFGLTADYFVKEIPIMHSNNVNLQFYPAVFLKFAVGYMP